MKVRSAGHYFFVVIALPLMGLTAPLASAAEPPRSAPAAAPKNGNGARTPVSPLELPPVEVFKIGPEDVLQISVWQNADLTRTVPVRPDGMISLPLLNDVRAAGLTPMQLRDDLKKKLEHYMPSVEVGVHVTEVNSFQVAVLGKVQKPGRLRLRTPTTVLQVIAEAGGFLDYADTEHITVMRYEPIEIPGRPWARTFKRVPFNYKRVIAAGGQTEDFALQPGDVVVVP